MSDKTIDRTILLGVNIDHIATIRQQRGTKYPDPIQAAFEAELAGANNITLHLREDRRHIQDRDVALLRDLLSIPMNLEMGATEKIIKIAEQICPACCCLVPEKREELTTEGGLDVIGQADKISRACQRLADVGVVVSLFVEADVKQIEASAKCGAKVIEIHTGHYADACNDRRQRVELQKIITAAEYAHNLGLTVHAGHGLNYHNVKSIAAIPQISELNIGHAIVARGLFTGLRKAVKEMKLLLLEARLGG